MMQKVISLVICACVVTFPLNAAPPEEIATLETVASQSVTDDELASPYAITGESLVNIIRGMVDFSVDGSSIVFNRRTGQIFIKQTPSNHLIIQDVLGRMRESQFKQVEIEARMVTIKATDMKGLGVDLANFNISSSNKGKQFGTQAPLGSGEGTGVNFPEMFNTADGGYGTQYSFVGTGDIFSINALIEAIESRTEVNTLAAPRVTVFNNQRAHLRIEKRQNFLSEVEAKFDTTEETPTSSNTSVWYQLEAKVKQAQSGTILDCVPSINNDGTIGLELHPMYVTANLSNVASITNITGGVEFDNPLTLPVFESQTIDTYITIPNGGVAILGGLITEDEAKSFQKVPFFGDIPVVGKLLFTQEKHEETKYYLMIFIKATVKNEKK